MKKIDLSFVDKIIPQQDNRHIGETLCKGIPNHYPCPYAPDRFCKYAISSNICIHDKEFKSFEECLVYYNNLSNLIKSGIIKREINIYKEVK